MNEGAENLDGGDSLIRREGQQGALFSAELEEAPLVELEGKGVFSGERLFEQKPLTYRQIVILSGHGVGQIRIGEVLGVSPSTVRAVQRREGQTIGILKTALSEHYLDVSGLAVEELRRRLEDKTERRMMATKDLVVLAGVVTDKAMVLAGQAQVPLEVADKGTNHEAFNAFLQGFGTGLGVGISGVKGGAMGGGQAAGAGGPGGAQGGGAGAGSGPVIDVEETSGGDSESPEKG